MSDDRGPNNHDMPDKMRMFFDAMAGQWKDYASPMSGLQMSTFKNFLDFQIGMMNKVKDQLDDPASGDPMDDLMNQRMRMMMSAWMDFMKFSRENRKTFMDMRCATLKMQLHFFENCFNAMTERMPSSSRGDDRMI